MTPPPTPAEPAPSKQPMPPVVNAPGALPATSAQAADADRRIGAAMTDKAKTEELRKELKKETSSRKADKAAKAKEPAKKKIRIVFVIDKTK